jgi:hypothetical protein
MNSRNEAFIDMCEEWAFCACTLPHYGQKKKKKEQENKANSSLIHLAVKKFM